MSPRCWRTVGVLAVTCLLTVGVPATATAGTSLGATARAAAETAGCVTRLEYRRVHKGMTMRRVTRIFDTRGNRQVIAHSGRFWTQIRNYNTCSRFSVVSISFDRRGPRPWRLTAKSAVWVS